MDSYNQICTQLLLSDATLALTFARMAENQETEEACARLVNRAWEAHEAISRVRFGIEMSEGDQQCLASKMDLLSRMLRSLDQRLLVVNQRMKE